MAGAFFVQPCPTCGRHLEVRVRYLGKRVVCRHCHGEFEARDPEAVNYDEPAACVSDLQRADQLLSQLDGSPHLPR